jgi:hypothetical protein
VSFQHVLLRVVLITSMRGVIKGVDRNFVSGGQNFEQLSWKKLGLISG